MAVPKSIQIRDVPDDVHATLRARAAAAGMSLSDYLRSEIVEIARQETVAEVLDRAARRHGGLTGDEAARAIREIRDFIG